MRDLIATLSKAVAQLSRIGRELDLDVQAASCIEAFRLSGEHRQVLHPRKDDHREAAILRLRAAWQSRASKKQRKRTGQLASHRLILPGGVSNRRVSPINGQKVV